MRSRVVVLGAVLAAVGGLIVVMTGPSGSASPTRAPAPLAAAPEPPYLTVDAGDGTTFTFAVESFTTGAQNSSTFTSGGGTTGKSTFLPLTIVKQRDRNTVLLQEYVLIGKHLPKVTFVYSPTGRYVLEDSLVTAVRSTGKGPASVEDEVVFNARKVRITHGSATLCFDIVTVAKCPSG